MRTLLASLPFGLVLMACTDGPDGPDSDDPDRPSDVGTIDADIDEDTVLTDRVEASGEVDYRVTKDTWFINAGLVVEPGVVIAFDPGVTVEIEYDDGYLEARCTLEKPCVFTSTEATAGAWGGLVFNSEDVRNVLSYCVIEYAGGAELNLGSVDRSAVAVVDFAGRVGKLSITNTVIQDSAGYGLFLDVGADLVDFAVNVIDRTADAPVRAGLEHVALLDRASTYRGDDFDGVEVAGGVLETSEAQTWRFLGEGVHHWLPDDVRLDAGLVLEPGVTLEMGGAVELRVDYDNGFLQALGTVDAPISFVGEEPIAGLWKGILVNSEDARNQLDHVVLSDAGGGDFDRNVQRANLAVVDFAGRQGRVEVTNSVVANSAGCGLATDGEAAFTESDNTFVDNAGADVCVGT